MITEEFLWTEKYRPKTVAETILPPDIKGIFQACVTKKNLLNFLLVGGPGIGKTTVALAMLNELKCEYIFVDGSLEGTIDNLRNNIVDFAATTSFKGTRKYVFIDEADYLTSKTQPALRKVMEDYAMGCGFIFSCNYENNIIEPIQSRCSRIDFTIKKDDKPKLALEFFKRTKEILRAEGVDYDEKVLISIIKKLFPDFRRILHELQKHGKIDTKLLLTAGPIKGLISLLQNKDFPAIRQWAAENNHPTVFRQFYDEAFEYFDLDFVPELVVTIADYQQKAAMVNDQEINLAAFLVEVMLKAGWKNEQKS